jgi:hypothetical protein
MTSHWVRPSSYQSLSCVDATTSASGTLGGRTWANIVPDIAPGEHAHRPGFAPTVLTVGVAQLVLCFPGVYAKQFVSPLDVPIIVVLLYTNLVLERYLLTASRKLVAAAFFADIF